MQDVIRAGRDPRPDPGVLVVPQTTRLELRFAKYGRFIMTKGFVTGGPLTMKKKSRLGGVYFLGVDTTCFMSLLIPARKDKHKKPRVRLRSGPILTTNKPRTDHK